MDSTNPVTISTTETSTEMPSGHQRSSTNARVCCDQANGVIQDSALPCSSSMSPAARSTKAPPRMPPAIALEVREYSLICTAAMLTPANTRPNAPVPAATATAPAIGAS